METLSGSYARDCAYLDRRLGVGKNYDLIARDVSFGGGRRGRIWCVDGYADDQTVERIISFWLSLPQQPPLEASTAEEFVTRFVSFNEVNRTDRTEELLTYVLAGKLLLLVEGIREGIAIDAKEYPSRGVEEPGDSRVLRGAHDGFVETLVRNTALLRRRIRDPRLTLEGLKLGNKSKTDVVLCYMEGLADEALLQEIREKLDSLAPQSFSMGQESVAEAMRQGQWYNPMPRVRYTERPDVASACVLEGDILLLIDNSPSVMLLPTALPDFVQEANDFYFPPLVGTYLRLVRMGVLLLSLLITPIWYLLVSRPERLPAALSFLAVEGEFHVPLFAQLLLVEFIVDVLKLASLNTPNVLSNSFSMLGALILGDFAVQARWMVPEVLVYMAFVAIAGFAQPSYELSYAIKLYRMLLLVCSAALGWWGFALGLAVVVLITATTRPIVGKSYLKSRRGMSLLRRPIRRDNT
ncbi:MAG: spore germination protein [Oscillospiraceae bacterium]